MRNFDGDRPFSQPPLQVAEIWLHVVDQQRWLAGRGYDGRVIRVGSQLNLAGRRRNIVDVQTG
jgi:hypothetical protein